MPVYLIRHGQSEFNAAYDETDQIDPMVFDAPLTDKGIQQAKATRAAVKDLGIKHVIASPLTRAIQTALHIFDGLAPITVRAGHHEYLVHSCDVGRQPAELQRDFPGLSFDHLDDIWWYQGPLNAVGVPVEPHKVFLDRVAKFTDDLAQMQDRPVAIIGHGDMLKALSGHQMANCEVHKYLK